MPPYGTSTACGHTVSGSFSLPSRGSFHLSLTVLSSIGRQVVFSLMRWSSRIPTGFHVPRGTWDPRHSPLRFRLRGSHALWHGFPPVSPSVAAFSCGGSLQLPLLVPLPLRRIACRLYHDVGLGSFPFARHYSGNRYFFLFLRVLGCFGSPGLPYIAYLFSNACMDITPYGLPHSDTHGSLPACGSPWLFAARCVLRRLLAPRHPPCALSSLTLRHRLHGTRIATSFCKTRFLPCFSLKRT